MLTDPDNYLMRYNFACTLAQQGQDAEGAIELLDGLVANGPKRLVNSIRIDPEIDPIREDPQFKTLLPKIDARLAN